MQSPWRTSWAIVLGGVLMPLIGFAVLAALTFLPLVSLLFAPRSTLTMLYQAGFVPSLVTAAMHVWLRRSAQLPGRTALAALAGAVTCLAWYAILGIFPALGWAQVLYCLIAAVSSALYFKFARPKSPRG
ncbi:MAG: hypothetical protein ACKVOL_13275 [Novosphingobium sp.]